MPVGPGKPPAYVGAGGGALVVGLAHLFPAGSFLNTLALYLAPVLSIVFGWLTLVLAFLVDEWIKTFVYKRTRKTLKETLEDPSTSDPIKAKTQAKLDELDSARVGSTLSGALKTLNSSPT